MNVSSFDTHSESLQEILKKADNVLGDLALLRGNIEAEIEGLQELLGEVGEREEKLACVLDLNRKYEE